MNYRTIWISDIHLGTRGCQADALVSFLKNNNCQKLYLVGDIIDGWRMKKKIYWPQEHTNVIRRILTKAKRGTEVVYVAGNHDEFLRNFLEYKLILGNVRFVDEDIHTTASGQRFLVLHGDRFDGITRYAKWVALLGDSGYTLLLQLNIMFNWVRRKLGLGYWSLSAAVKQKVKTAVNFISNYEHALATEAKKRSVDGVICGHIHHAERKMIEDIVYANCGDWVESCTALVEHYDGTLDIIRWNNGKNNNSNRRMA